MFPLGYSTDAEAISAVPVLDASGQVIVSVYPSGAIGGLVPDIGSARYVRDHPSTS
jgi:hypothetical protein